MWQIKLGTSSQIPQSQFQLNSLEWIQKSDEDRIISFDRSKDEENKTQELINQIQTEADLESEVMRL
jgi:hypothetical protein